MKRVEARQLGGYIKRSFMLFSVLPMLLAGCLGMLLLIHFYEVANREMLEATLGHAKDDMEYWLEDSVALLKACAEEERIVSQMQSARTLDEDGQSLIKALLAGRGGKQQIHILSRNGVFRYSSGSIPNIYKMPVYEYTGIFRMLYRDGAKAAIRATKYTSYNGKQIALTLGVPVYGSAHEIVGCVLLDIYRDTIDEMLESYGHLFITDMLLHDQNGIVSYNSSGHYKEGLRLPPEKMELKEGSHLLTGRSVYEIPLSEGALSLNVLTNTEFRHTLYMAIMIGLACMLLIVMTVAWVVGTLVSKRISGQTERLLRVIREGPSTSFTSEYTPAEGDFEEIIRLGQYHNEMNRQTRTLIHHVEEKQRLLAAAELSVLRTQMRPHFFYNLLNDIKSLAKLSRTKEIIELVVCFSTLLRSSLATDEEFCTLAEEIELVERYVHMQNLRMLPAVELRLYVDPALRQAEIPRLLLQPLVENALLHGLTAEVPQPIVRIDAKRRDGRLWLRVIDNGEGMKDVNAPKKMDGISYHTGIGIENIRKRLHLYYGDKGELRIRSREGGYTLIELYLEI